MPRPALLRSRPGEGAETALRTSGGVCWDRHQLLNQSAATANPKAALATRRYLQIHEREPARVRAPYRPRRRPESRLRLQQALPIVATDKSRLVSQALERCCGTVAASLELLHLPFWGDRNGPTTAPLWRPFHRHRMLQQCSLGYRPSWFGSPSRRLRRVGNGKTQFRIQLCAYLRARMKNTR